MWRTRRNAGRWLAPCRDIADRHRKVVVTPIENGRVALIVPVGEVAVFDLLGVGRLRGALRDAAWATDEPETAHLHRHAIAMATGGARSTQDGKP